VIGRLLGALLGNGPTLLGPGGAAAGRRRASISYDTVVGAPLQPRQPVENDEALALALLARGRRFRITRIEQR
jgi:hypothetical protein